MTHNWFFFNFRDDVIVFPLSSCRKLSWQIKNSDSLIIFPLELETVTEYEECESDSNDDSGSIFADKYIAEEMSEMSRNLH